MATSSGASGEVALIVDGKSLGYALEDDVKDKFLALALGCASVICCRSSPKQKALVSYNIHFKLSMTGYLTCINVLLY